MTSTTPQICQSAHCACPTPDASGFCSARCARHAVGGVPAAACDCGHDTCTSDARPSATDPRPGS